MSSNSPSKAIPLKAKAAALIVRVAITLVGHLPLSWVRGLGATFGRMSLLLNSRMAVATQQNIAYCLPELNPQEQQALVAASLQETGKLALETAVVWARGNAWVCNHILNVDGREHLTAAIERKQGVLVLAPHIGNWEVVNYFLASCGDVTNMYQEPKTAGMNEILQDYRTRCGATLVPTDRKGLMTILKVLKTGGISGILPDQTPKEDNSGIFAPFMAQHAFTMTLAHKLIQKSGCLPLFVYAERVKGGFNIVIRPAPSNITSSDEQEAVNALSEGIEQCVRAIPAQYQWEYKRFRKRLHDLPNPYQPNT